MFLRLCKTFEDNSKAKAPAARCSAETSYFVRKKRRIDMGFTLSTNGRKFSNKPHVLTAEGTGAGQEFPKIHNLILKHNDLKRPLSSIIRSLTRITTTEK
jgi:hypothetical protein